MADYPRGVFFRRALLALALVAIMGATATTAVAAPTAATVKVWFLKGEQMAAVTRPGSIGAGGRRRASRRAHGRRDEGRGSRRTSLPARRCAA